MATLAGILLVVAYNMSEWRVFLKLLRGPRSDVLVLLTTFLLTVLVDLTVALQAGVVLAALLLMRRMAEVTQVRAVPRGLAFAPESEETPAQRPELPEGVDLFEIQGSFCFGAAQKFSEILSSTGRHSQVVILRMREVFAMDATGLQALEEVVTRFQRQGTRLLVSGIQPQPQGVLKRSGLLARIGEENLLPSTAEAVERAQRFLEETGPESEGPP
ncbi:MAG: STAS domain-containing protein, partial [Acidobacteria bacterium]|nr:STAS domain-containing protein [Acidobacteriota bacterium]